MPVAEARLPDDAAEHLVERHDRAVHPRDVDEPLAERDAARDVADLREARIVRRVVVPEMLPGGRVDRAGVTGTVLEIHHALVDERIALGRAARVLRGRGAGTAEVPRPRELQRRDVRRVDLVERRVVLRRKVAVDDEPVVARIRIQLIRRERGRRRDRLCRAESRTDDDGTRHDDPDERQDLTHRTHCSPFPH